jgi:O-antigen ligase
MRLLLILFILSLSFTSAFQVFKLFALPLLIAGVAWVAVMNKGLVSGRIDASLLRREDLAIIAFIAVGAVAVFLQDEGVVTKNIQYTGRYVAIFGLYLFTVAVLAAIVNRKTLLNTLAISVAIAAGFGIAEFMLRNVWDFRIEQYLYRSLRPTEIAAFGGDIVRARSFTEEPGAFALFVITLAPVAVFGILKWRRKRYAVLFVTLAVAALAISFSAGGVVGATFALLTGGLVYVTRAKVKWFAMHRLIFVVLLILPAIGIVMISTGDLLDPIISKLTLQSPVVQEQRVDRWATGVALFYQEPVLGHGFGSIWLLNDGVSFINWYVDILVETGLVGFVLMWIFLVATLFRAYRLESNAAPFYVAGLMGALVQYAAISTFWYPWIWFVVILVRHEEREERKDRMAASAAALDTGSSHERRPAVTSPTADSLSPGFRRLAHKPRRAILQ